MLKDAESVKIRNAQGFIDSENPLHISRGSIADYTLQDVDQPSSTLDYLGKEKNDGTWLVVEIDSSSGNSFRYANESNNNSYTTYTTAYAARASLTYDLLEELTGL